jgi:hypothetical protein
VTPLPVNIISGGSGGTQYAEDTAHVSGDLVTLAGVVQQTADAALSGDGDRSLLQVDSTGWVKATVKASVLPTGASTAANQATEVTSLQLIDDIVYTDDTSTHATGTSKGALLMAAATPTDAAVNANDIGAVAMTTDRKLHVSVQDAIPAGTNNIGDVDVLSVIPGTAATNLGKAVDSAKGASDTGVQMLGIRDDTLSVFSNAENDYEPLHLTAAGRLYTSATVDAALPAGTNNIGDVDVLSIAAGNNNIGDVDIASLPNEGQQTMANSISVAIASDQAAFVSTTTLTALNTVFDASPTSATSAAVTCTSFRKFQFSYEVVKSAGTPTDIQFFVQFNNGATWCDYRNDFWGQLLYDDVATASKLARCHSGDCAGATSMRVKAVATGTGAAASFTVTNATLELKN